MQARLSLVHIGKHGSHIKIANGGHVVQLSRRNELFQGLYILVTLLGYGKHGLDFIK